MVSVPQFTQLLSRIQQQVLASTGLSSQSESSIVNSILSVFCAEMINIWSELQYIESQGQISSATSTNLDSIGAFFGVTRSAAVTSTTLGSPSSVNFTNTGGTTATVSVGTRVWPSSNPQVSYTTTSAISIPAGQTGYVDVIADAPGQNFNVGANQIDSNNSGLLALTVTNDLPITNGSNLETDADYRVRIQQEIYRKEGANLTAVRSFLLDVPGVRDVQINNFSRGTGTFDVLIYGYDVIVPDTVIANCQAVLDQVVAAGISATALAPVVVYVDVSIQLILTASANFTADQAIVSSAIQSYLNNLPIENGTGNGTLVYNELLTRIISSTSDIINANILLTVADLPSLKSDQTLPAGSRFVSRVISVS